MTRCKFKCSSKTEKEASFWDSVANVSKWGKVYDFEFWVVSGNSEENKQFFASTPSGKINVATVRDDTFQVGKEYYLDFTEVVYEG